MILNRRILLITILVILLIPLSFFFWGSRPLHSEANYSKVHEITLEAAPLNPDTFTLMTYNIGYLSGMTNNLAVERSKALYDQNLLRAFKLMSSTKVDIVAFQEIDIDSHRSFRVNQLHELAESGDFKYSAEAVNWDKRYVPFPFWPPSRNFGMMLSGQAAMSKYAITSSDRIVLPKPASNSYLYNKFYIDRVIQIMNLEIGGRSVKLMNVHLEAFDNFTRESQAARTLAIYRDLVATFPVILVGDFNSEPPFAPTREAGDDAMYAFFNEPGLAAAIDRRRYTANEPDFLTFSSGNPKSKLDYIFYSTNDFQLLESRVVLEAQEISDHLPVMARLVLRSNR